MAEAGATKPDCLALSGQRIRHPPQFAQSAVVAGWVRYARWLHRLRCQNRGGIPSDYALWLRRRSPGCTRDANAATGRFATGWKAIGMADAQGRGTAYGPSAVWAPKLLLAA